jgi:hypothetical protein
MPLSYTILKLKEAQAKSLDASNTYADFHNGPQKMFHFFTSSSEMM